MSSPGWKLTHASSVSLFVAIMNPLCLGSFSLARLISQSLSARWILPQAYFAINIEHKNVQRRVYRKIKKYGKLF